MCPQYLLDIHDDFALVALFGRQGGVLLGDDVGYGVYPEAGLVGSANAGIIDQMQYECFPLDAYVKPLRALHQLLQQLVQKVPVDGAHPLVVLDCYFHDDPGRRRDRVACSPR